MKSSWPWHPTRKDFESLEQLHDDELRDLLPNGPDPYRQAIVEMNRTTTSRSSRAAWNAKYRTNGAGNVTAECLDEIRDEQGDSCFWCGLDLDGCGQLDHVTPVALGGTSDRDNLVWSCAACNARKRAMTPDEWDSERWSLIP